MEAGAVADGDPSAEWRRRFSRHRLSLLGAPILSTSPDVRPLTGIPARVVTLLAATFDRWMTIDELIEAVWSGAEPDTARPALHVHLGTVRRWLSGAGEGAPTVARSESGYRLALNQFELDLTLVLDATLAGRDLVAERPVAAIEVLREMLSLFRGPLGGTAEQMRATESTSRRLDACRLAAEEHLVEAMLATADFAGAEMEAMRLVDACPYREVRWAQLMRARALDNRTHDALRTYRTVRDLLVGELGIEPGPLLQSVERSLLVQDLPALAPAGSPPLQSPAPPRLDSFVGREAQLAACRAAVAVGSRLVIHGPPGVGTTRLAEELCRTLDVSDPVVWIELGSSGTFLEATITALGLPAGADLDDVAGSLGAGSVLAFDGADRSIADIERLIDSLGNRAHDVLVITTTRRRAGRDWAHVEVPPLSTPGENHELGENACAELLQAALSELAPSVRLTDDEVVRLCHMSGGLALAIRSAAAEMRVLATPLRVELAQAAVVAEYRPRVIDSLDQLDHRDREVLTALSVIAVDFDLHVAAAVVGAPATDLVMTIGRLVNCGLIDVVPGPPARYRTLDPIRAAIVELLDDDTRRRGLDRLTDHSIAGARELAASIRVGDQHDLESRTEGLIGCARIAIAHLAETCEPERALELASRLDSACYSLGWWTEKNELLDRALAIEGRRTAARARALALRGRSGLLSRFDLGQLRQAEEIASALGNTTLAAFADHLIGIALWWHGEHEASLAASRSAIDVFTSAGRAIETLEASKFVGLALLQSGDVAAGIAVQQATLAEFERRHISFHVAHSLAYLGHSHRFLGDHQAARPDLEAALDLCRQIGNRGTAIHVHLALGELAAERSEHSIARQHATDALQLIETSHLLTYEPWAWTLLLRSWVGDGDLDTAAACARQALATLRHAPQGDSRRLAIELAALAIEVDEFEVAARLVGSSQRRIEPREMPLEPAAERLRVDHMIERIGAALGASEANHVIVIGQRCSVAEALSSLLERRFPHV